MEQALEQTVDLEGREPNRLYVELAPDTIASDYALQSLNKALGEAQNEYLPAVKGEVNTYGGYKYTPLIVIVSAVRPALTKYHLTVSQFARVDLETKTVTVYTRLVHWDSGEWMQNALELPAELALGKGGTPVFNQQTIGGSQTYAQKYAYKAILGIPDSEEMIDSKEEKGDLPARKKSQAEVRASAQRRAQFPQNSSVPPDFEPNLPSENSSTPPGASTAKQATQSPSQPPANAQRAAQGQAGGIKFIPPNGLTVTVKGVKEIAGLPARPAEGNVPAMKAVRPRMVVTLLGTHNGVDEASCFDTKLFPVLKESVGLECHFQIAEKDAAGKHYINIEDVIYVAGEEYSNGIPIIPL